MNKELTDVTVIVDRSGSMQSCQIEAENGLNQFIDDQKKTDGQCNFTLVQFDNEYEIVHDGVNINDVPKFSLIPRGMTALLDAVGKTINTVGERLAKIDEQNRPGLVVVAIITDGHENASHKFTRYQIRQMIEKQQDEYSWKFTFLGANQDAFKEAASMGINTTNTSSYVAAKTGHAYSALSSTVTRGRVAASMEQEVAMTYTDEERESME